MTLWLLLSETNALCIFMTSIFPDVAHTGSFFVWLVMIFCVLMHGVALLDRWRGLVFALHVTFLLTDSSDACSVASCSLLIIKLLLLHHTHPNHHISGTSRRARRLSGISATVLSLACRCGCCFSASVLLLSFDYRIGISVFLGSIRDFNGIRMYVPYIYKPA